MRREADMATNDHADASTDAAGSPIAQVWVSLYPSSKVDGPPLDTLHLAAYDEYEVEKIDAELLAWLELRLADEVPMRWAEVVFLDHDFGLHQDAMPVETLVARTRDIVAL